MQHKEEDDKERITDIGITYGNKLEFLVNTMLQNLDQNSIIEFVNLLAKKVQEKYNLNQKQ